MRALVAGMLFTAVIAVAMGAVSETWNKNQRWIVIVADSIDELGNPKSKRYPDVGGYCNGFEPFCVDNGKVYLRKLIQ